MVLDLLLNVTLPTALWGSRLGMGRGERLESPQSCFAHPGYVQVVARAPQPGWRGVPCAGSPGRACRSDLGRCEVADVVPRVLPYGGGGL